MTRSDHRESKILTAALRMLIARPGLAESLDRCPLRLLSEGRKPGRITESQHRPMSLHCFKPPTSLLHGSYRGPGDRARVYSSRGTWAGLRQLDSGPTPQDS